jgi:hypothetical protein
LAELLEHESVHAFADGCKKHHRCDANGDAQRGQQRAAAVGGDGTGGQSEKV